MKNRHKVFITWAIIILINLTGFQSRGQVLIALLFGDKLNSGNLEFGLTGGLNASNINAYQGTNYKTGLTLGLYFNIRINDRWYIHPEAIPKYPTGVDHLQFYSLGDQVLDSLFGQAAISRTVKNITVPLLVRYRICKLFFAEAGPQIGLRTKAKDEFKAGDHSYENEVTDHFTRFDFGIALGLNQRLSSKKNAMSLGIRYYIGLTDIDKFTEGSQKNGVFQALLSIPVGAEKSQD
jgi:hypothetical protein